MYPFKLKPATKAYIWGGDRLRNEYGVQSQDSIVAEAWMLSCNAAGASTISSGPLAGQTLGQALFSEIDKVLGENNSLSVYFPILIKFIDAKQNLSIQVHPDNCYALEHELVFGKTEMWYVLDADKDAYLYYGFKRAITKEEFRERIENNSITSVLNRVPVKKGDVFFIEAGTIHSIGKGILIAEIQQNSDTTYRVYDYARTDANGHKRELHIKKALDVTDTAFVPGIPDAPSYISEEGYRTARLASCEYFTVDHLDIDSSARLICDTKSFTSLLFIDGKGRIIFEEDSVIAEGNAIAEGSVIDVKKGDSLFLPAGTGAFLIEGKCSVLLTVK